MPDTQGTWHYSTRSNLDALNDREGTFTCVAPIPGNHGPVRVCNTYHFAYADGTAYKPIGTTCYAWTHQGEQLEEQTLTTLRNAPFNKLRMCIFPKYYIYNENEPEYYPFPCLSHGSSTWDIEKLFKGEMPEGWSFDFSRFDPAFFQHFERRIADLMELGIEANIGPLGHGLPIAVGAAIAAKLTHAQWRTFVLTGDGELQEGSNWEAAMAGAHFQLDNLITIVDCNRLQQGDWIEQTMHLDPLADKWRAFGWSVTEVDGHNHQQLLETFAHVPFEPGKPNCIIAHTHKGQGVSFMQDKAAWHHRVPTTEQLAAALAELKGERNDAIV